MVQNSPIPHDLALKKLAGGFILGAVANFQGVLIGYSLVQRQPNVEVQRIMKAIGIEIGGALLAEVLDDSDFSKSAKIGILASTVLFVALAAGADGARLNFSCKAALGGLAVGALTASKIGPISSVLLGGAATFMFATTPPLT